MPTFSELREQHPTFHYRSVSTTVKPTEITISWEFVTEPGLAFHPSLTITFPRAIDISPERVRFLAFHLGLVEMLSYWKATCSPQLVIHPHILSDELVAWWKELLQKGLGEFFYTNQIDLTAPDLVSITHHSAAEPLSVPAAPAASGGILVPIGGGKDSAVSAQILQATDRRLTPFFLNPTPAALATAEVSNLTDSAVRVERTIDPHLLELNERGYLNGHTPFSAYLAFLTTLAAEALNIADIALSNEASANECNVRYQGVEINHQYSKTHEFETAFRSYSATQLHSTSSYFSFLRPLHEVQIAQIFSRHQDFFPVFRSCNRGSKTNTWCHRCSKCLFAYTMLFPFVDYQTLTSQIFEHDLYTDDGLLDDAVGLVEQDQTKPFECVGSYRESKACFSWARDWYRTENTPLPVVLATLEERDLLISDASTAMLELLADWNSAHYVPTYLETILRDNLLKGHDDN